MNGRLTQPKVDGYINCLGRNDHFGTKSYRYDAESCRLLDEFFALLKQVAPASQNGTRILWLRAERGPIEDFGNAEEEIADGEYETEEEFVEAWKSWFPDEIKWYQLQAVEDETTGYRAIMLRHTFVIVQDERGDPMVFPMDISEFVQWLLDGVRDCIRFRTATAESGACFCSKSVCGATSCRLLSRTTSRCSTTAA